MTSNLSLKNVRTAQTKEKQKQNFSSYVFNQALNMAHKSKLFGSHHQEWRCSASVANCTPTCWYETFAQPFLKPAVLFSIQLICGAVTVKQKWKGFSWNLIMHLKSYSSCKDGQVQVSCWWQWCSHLLCYVEEFNAQFFVLINWFKKCNHFFLLW